MQRAEVEIGGKRSSYVDEGTGDAVLYLHGFPTSGFLWREVIAQVSTGFRCVAPDFPGSGRSELMDGPHSWEGLIRWLDRFVEELDLAPVHLGVHDWGGLIGLGWAAQHPAKVSSMLISDTSFRAGDRWHAAAQQWRTPGVGEEMLGGLTKQSFAGLLGAVTDMSEMAIEEYWKGLDTHDRRMAKLEMYRSLDFPMLAPLERKLPEVSPGKVLIIWGEDDVFVTPKTAHRLAKALGTSAELVSGASHFLHEDAGKVVGRRHLEFLKSL